MKNLSLKICLVIAALFGSVVGAVALPICPPEVYSEMKDDRPGTRTDKYGFIIKEEPNQPIISGIRICFLEEYNKRSSYVGAVKWFSREQYMRSIGKKKS